MKYLDLKINVDDDQDKRKKKNLPRVEKESNDLTYVNIFIITKLHLLILVIYSPLLRSMAL